MEQMFSEYFTKLHDTKKELQPIAELRMVSGFVDFAIE